MIHHFVNRKNVRVDSDDKAFDFPGLLENKNFRMCNIKGRRVIARYWHHAESEAIVITTHSHDAVTCAQWCDEISKEQYLEWWYRYEIPF